MCLGPGRAPLPVPSEWAVCGPRVRGTVSQPPGKELADLNPCPLNTCCDTRGQCGITAEYCVVTKSVTGAPGTAALGTESCVSNCGHDIVNNHVPSASFMSVGYFQPLAANRPCLKMDVTQINHTTQYTHIQYAFATLTDDLKISVDDFPDQWARFLQLQGAKRIVSFGATPIANERLRQATASSNRTRFANNLAAFAKQTQIDGIDLDWEYPATEKEGFDYVELLRLVKSALPARLLSVAVPPGFYNLKAYPMDKIGQIVDYIVFMAYDMHGQWDFGSPWASSGCPQANCVRSHVNLTETIDGLSMITKAGVPAAKVVVGMASYGRAFELAMPGCSSPDCQFTKAGAQPGQCTQYPGILAIGEIEEIIELNRGSVKHWYDQASDSNIMVINNTQWVAYMDSNIKIKRSAKYKGLGFGGTVDWSVDYQRKPMVYPLPPL